MITPILLSLGFLGVVHGAAAPAPAPAPAPTPAARLEDRDQPILTIWSPSVIGTSLVYIDFERSGSSSVVSSSSYWGWCQSPGVCYYLTSCTKGTIYYLDNSVTCDATAPLCGTEYLYTTVGATSGLTRAACFETTGTLEESYFVVSPTVASTTSPTSPVIPVKTTTPVSTPATTPPTPIISTPATTPVTPTPIVSPPTKSKSKTPVGPIVGGVIGGIAVIAAAIVAILLLMRKNRKNPPPPPAAEVVQQQYPPVVPQDPKQNHYVSTASAPSPPMYQQATSPNPNQQHYPPPQENYGAPPPNTHNYNSHAMTSSPPPPSASPSVPSPTQYQFGNLHSSGVPSPTQMYSPPPPNTAELHSGR